MHDQKIIPNDTDGAIATDIFDINQYVTHSDW